MRESTPEYSIIIENNSTLFRFRKQKRNFERYFSDFTEPDPLDEAALDGLADEAVKVSGTELRFSEKRIAEDILIVTEGADIGKARAFAGAFLEALGDFYEKHEVHITRMFGSFVFLKRENGELRAIKATPVPISYCPLMRQLLTEVGGEAATELMSAVSSGDAQSQTRRMCELINSIVIGGGYFDTSRPLNSCEANVLFGASETMSTAFRSGLIDAAVIVSNNLGTIITTNESNTQGAVKRMTGLFLTSPARKIMQTARDSGIIPVFPHTASIDQFEGVKRAIALGYKRIAVSVAWMDNILLNEIGRLEGDGVTIYKFGLCSTGIDYKTAEAMAKNADLVWSCASKAVRETIEPNAIAQVGVKIPVHIMTSKGWTLVNNHLKVTEGDRNGKTDVFEDIVCLKGKDKPVILNGENSFHVFKAGELKPCTDCPHPCV